VEWKEGTDGTHCTRLPFAYLGDNQNTPAEDQQAANGKGKGVSEATTEWLKGV